MKKFLVALMLVSILTGVGVCGNNRSLSASIDATTEVGLLENGASTYALASISTCTVSTVIARDKRIQCWVVNLSTEPMYISNISFNATTPRNAESIRARGWKIPGNALTGDTGMLTNIFKITTQGAWYITGGDAVTQNATGGEVRVLDVWSNIR